MSEAETGQALIGDAELITAIRSGDMSAYGELYQRHIGAAQALARQLVHGPAEVDDVVAETFSKVLDLMRRGGGPQDAFRPYLLTAVRRVAYDRHRGERRSVVTGEIEAYDPGVPFIDPAVAGLERSLIARAFLSLPERWRAVLWHTEIEGAKPADVAPLLGLTANGVAALAYRAREGLRQAYLQMHLSGVAKQECRPVAEKLGAFVRGGLSARESKVISDHLDGCADCRAVYAELADVNVGLRGIVAPIILGPVAAAYLAAVYAKGGAIFGWFAGKVLWVRHAPKSQQAAMAGGLAAAVAAIAVLALALTGHSTAPPHSPHRLAAAPPPSHAASPPEPAPAPKPHQAPTPPASPPVAVAHRAPSTKASPASPGTPPPPTSPPPTSPPPTSPPPTSPPPPPPPPPPVMLTAQVDPVGALLRGSTGMLVFKVANTGQQAAHDLAANVKLPPGVSFLGAGALGMAAPAAVSVGGGWSCAAGGAGAQCTHGPLGPGQTTTSYVQVAVGQNAAFGPPPAISVSSGGKAITTAKGSSGVVRSGLPPRFVAAGRLDTIMVGNVLPPFSWHPRRQGNLGHLGRLGLGFGWEPPSSSARVALPGGVLWAGLYWSGAGGQLSPRINLRGPGGQYRMVSADSVSSTQVLGYPVYQAYANVTGMMSADGSGTWQAQVPPGDDHAADTGWSLVVVAQDPAAPPGQAVVVDGAHIVSDEDPSFTVPLNGLLPAGASAGIQLTTWRGFGYGEDPALASRRERLTANPAVDLTANGGSYLVGVVAASTSADSTELGPCPEVTWPGERWWHHWLTGLGVTIGWPLGGCDDLGFGAGPGPRIGHPHGAHPHGHGSSGAPHGSPGTGGHQTAGSHQATGGGQPPSSCGTGQHRGAGERPRHQPKGCGQHGSQTGQQGAQTGLQGAQTGQNLPLPGRLQPNPCPVCELTRGLGLGG